MFPWFRWAHALLATDESLSETHSPELYLRRPPARNAQYRLDTMLKAAAERGVMIYVIVYKEVPQALTRKCIVNYPVVSRYTA